MAMTIYETLRDEWEYMGGNYIGKNLSNIFSIFKLYHIDESEHLLTYKLIRAIDTARQTLIREKNKA